MADSRFDKRSKKTFKQDIKFGTMLETYFFTKFIDICKSRDDIFVDNVQNNGVDNNGEFVESGKSTAGADYKIDINYRSLKRKNHPLEVKWIPTAGKLTLKLNDMKAYHKEGASILFIYNTKSGVNLKKPADYDFEKHIKRIEDQAEHIRWGVMYYCNVLPFMREHVLDIKPISYMGGKPGIVLKQEDFAEWFVEEKWEIQGKK